MSIKFKNQTSVIITYHTIPSTPNTIVLKKKNTHLHDNISLFQQILIDDNNKDKTEVNTEYCNAETNGSRVRATKVGLTNIDKHVL